MSPAQRASQVESHAGFTSDLAAHLAPGGVVVSTDRFFIMLRPVRRDAEPDGLLNPWLRWDQPDAVMVWLAAGDMAEALAFVWPQVGEGKCWVAFQRDGPARFVRVTLLQSLYGKRRRRKQRQGDQAAAAVDAGQPTAGEVS